MADLVPGLLICLMAVQTIQHDGKFIKIPKEFTKRITTFILVILSSRFGTQIKVTKQQV